MTAPHPAMPVNDNRLPWWGAATGPEIAAWLARADAVAVLPLAAIEQHGPHLPLDTDLRLNLGLLAAAFKRLGRPAWLRVLPPLAPAASREHAGFPGSLALDERLCRDWVEQAVVPLAAQGLRRIVCWNTHGGNVGWLDAAALTLRRHGLLAVKVHIFRLDAPSKRALEPHERAHDLHGGRVETALMRHLAPEAVRDTEVRAFAPRAETLGFDEALGFEGHAAIAWQAEDLHPAGVVGRADLGDAAFGARLADEYAGALAATLDRVRRLDPNRVFGARATTRAQRSEPSVGTDPP